MVAGNVMVYLAAGTEREVLRVLSGLLVPGGRIVTGFATDRDYTVADLDRTPRRWGCWWSTGSPPGTWIRGLTGRIGRSPCCGGKRERECEALASVD